MEISKTANIAARAISQTVSGLSINEHLFITAIIQLAMNGADESEFERVNLKSIKFK